MALSGKFSAEIRAIPLAIRGPGTETNRHALEAQDLSHDECTSTQGLGRPNDASK